MEQRALLDYDALWFELERFKAERSWHNIAIAQDAPRALLERADWYRLYIPPSELEASGWDRVRVWQDAAVALLKKYCERHHRLYRGEWEEGKLEYEELKPDDGNFFAEYTVHVPRENTEILEELRELREDLEASTMRDRQRGALTALSWDRHLYVPLLAASRGGLEVRPTALNDGERWFVEGLRRFCAEHQDDLATRSVYLLRNQSRGKGIGFFEEGGFYPDFLLWITDASSQKLVFIDPHGLMHARGDEDRKIRFADRVKEHQARLGREDAELDSFLFSETAYQSVSWWGHSQRDLELKHVLFPQDDPQKAFRRMFELLGPLPAVG